MNKEIQTNRLILTPISLKYLEEIFSEFTPDITTFMIPQPTGNIADTEDFIRGAVKRIEKGETLLMVILDQQTKEFFGCAELMDIHTKHPAFGVWLKKSAHGNGYGKEAVTALKDWADGHLQYEYISYPVAPENIASTKIPESLGGIVVKNIQKEKTNGEPLLVVEYRMYKENTKSIEVN